MPRFVSPPASIYEDPSRDYLGLAPTYAAYNYLRPGLVSWVKRQHFEQALRLAGDLRGAAVVDFGCADGVFLPTLAAHCRRVVGVEQRRGFAAIAADCAATCEGAKVEVVCNDGVGWGELRARLGPGFEVAFLLEVLEHVGTPGTDAGAVYAEKVELLREVLGLLEPGGRAVVSVPVMVGLPFLAQRAALRLAGAWREPLTWGELVRATVGDVRALEERWDGEHLGFSHRRLERALVEGGLRIARRRHLGVQVLYVVALR